MDRVCTNRPLSLGSGSNILAAAPNVSQKDMAFDKRFALYKGRSCEIADQFVMSLLLRYYPQWKPSKIGGHYSPLKAISIVYWKAIYIVMWWYYTLLCNNKTPVIITGNDDDVLSRH